MSRRRICVFAGSGVGNDTSFVEAARELGTGIAERGHDLVFGGESVGLMGAVADAVIEAGGEAVGVIPRFLSDIGTPHEGAEIMTVDTLAERKAVMADLSAGFVVLPGGLGTLDELTEMVTWTQLGVHRDKPLALLDVRGCWAGLSSLLDGMVANGFLLPEGRDLLAFTSSADAALGAVIPADLG